MKLIGKGAFIDGDEKHDESVRYVLGMGSVGAMVVGFGKIEEVGDFAARVRKVPLADGSARTLAHRAARVA